VGLIKPKKKFYGFVLKASKLFFCKLFSAFKSCQRQRQRQCPAITIKQETGRKKQIPHLALPLSNYWRAVATEEILDRAVKSFALCDR
jgi:hypothetical protein